MISIKLILAFATTIFGCLSWGVISSSTFEAKLISYDKVTAVIEVNNRRVKVPKSSLNFDSSHKLKNVTLSGDDFINFLKTLSN